MYRVGIFLSTASGFLGRVFAIISGIILAKVLAPELLGMFVGDQALVLIGGGLINLGIGQGYRMIISRNPELHDEYLLPTLLLRIGATVLYFLGLLLYLAKTGKLQTSTMLVVVGTLLFSTMELLRIDLEVRGSYKSVTILAFGRGMILFLSAVFCWLTKADYRVLVWSYLVLVLLFMVISFCLVKPAIVPVFSFNYRHLIKNSFPFAVALFAYAFTTYWGLIYIRDVLGREQAGYFSVPLKVYQMSLVIGMSVTGITLPLYHKLAARKDFQTFARVFNRLISGMWFLAGPIVAVCFFIPKPLVKVFATEQYLSAVPVFPWIGFGIMFRLLAIPAGNILESVDRQWYRVIIQVVGAGICVSGVCYIVPIFGIIGAAWMLFAVDIWTLLAYWVVSKCFVPDVVTLRKLFMPCLSLIAMLCLFACLEIRVWYKLILFCALWSGYVLFLLNFKEEFYNYFQRTLK